MLSTRDSLAQLLSRQSYAPEGLTGYQAEPALELILSNQACLCLGHSGPLVRAMQDLINLLALGQLLALDGLFGPLTQQAVRDAQNHFEQAPSGSLDAALLALLLTHGLGREREPEYAPMARGPRNAPRFDQRPGEGSVPLSSMLRQDEARRRGAPASPRTSGERPTVERPSDGGEPRAIEPITPDVGQSQADAELAQLQTSSIASARRELAAGVRADGNNRGTRVDQYERDAGMNVGGAWCGYFTGFNYNEAARESGGRFKENIRFHSMQKARSYFEYRNYTNNSRGENDRLDRLREQQVGEGSARRWMTLSGSAGHRHAASNDRPHEVYEPGTLPIRSGDTALFSRGHVGMVESYDRSTGQLVTIEGNSTGRRVCRNTYDLNKAEDRARFEGFGRPARSDFEVAAPVPSGPQAPSPTPAPVVSGPNLNLPPRAADAPSGSQFLAVTRSMSRAEREDAILSQIKAGNVPDHLRQFKEVQVSSKGPDGRSHSGTVRVLPDYLAIGSNEDFVRIPMTPRVAQAIADQTGTSLPTRKLVNDVYSQADVKLTPQPLPAGAQMMSNEYYARHQTLVEQQRRERGASLDALTAGDKKDLVISNQLSQHPDRVAIYGWHQPNGKAIQGLSTVHEAGYADYSHGVRLVSGSMMVDGVERRVADVLRDPELAALVSDEGVIRNARVPRS